MSRKRASEPALVPAPEGRTAGVRGAKVRGTEAPVERRQGLADRRSASADRRDPDRLQQDIAPRRNPDQADRRKR